jgi:hypothetical protein
MSSSGAIQGVGMRVAAQKRRSVETPTSRPSQGSAEGARTERTAESW